MWLQYFLQLRPINTQTKQQFSSTSLPCSWLSTSFQFVNFSKVAEMDFKAPTMKRKSSLLTDCNERPSEQKKLDTQIPKPTEGELHQCFVNLSKTEGKPVLLSTIPDFSDSYIPVSHLPNFPKPLTELFDPTVMTLSYPELPQQCEELYNNYVITADQAEVVEENTRQQAKSKMWFQQKSGRVTASRLKSVITTDASQPSVSLIKSICYPDAHKFYSVACSYGCKHEDTARKEYVYEMRRNHVKFAITESGLVLDPLYPFLGASLDGLVSCDCCGKGVLVIKCPYSCKQKDLVKAVEEDSRFFLYESEEGAIKLKESHQYYYQVQMQMKFCNAEYCDFVVWNKESWINERIYANSDFINDCITKTVDFIKLGILPELVGR